VGRELDGGGRGEHDGVGREEGAWGGELDGGARGGRAMAARARG